MDDLIRFLAISELFKDISPADLKEFAGILKEETCSRDRTIFVEDDVGDHLYVILEGAVKIGFRATWKDQQEDIIEILGPGEIFGEFSFIDGRRRSATAAAIEPCRLLTLSRAEFDDFSIAKPMVALGIMHNYAWIVTTKVRKTTMLWRSSLG